MIFVDRKKSERMKKIGILILLVCFMISPLSVNAYVLNGLRVPNPQSVTYWVETNNATATYTEVDAVISAIPSWQIHCPELKIVRSNSNNADMNFYFRLNQDNGMYSSAYAETIAYKKEIIFYRPWKSLTITRKQETAVHEAGHMLGLAHCQAQYNSEAVMRATGFNNVGCPLADDKRGIAALY